MARDGDAATPWRRVCFAVVSFAGAALVGCALPGYEFTGGGGSASTGGTSAGGSGAQASGGVGGAGNTGGAGADGGHGGGVVEPYLGTCPGSGMVPASSAVSDDFFDSAASGAKWSTEGLATFANKEALLSPIAATPWAALASELDVSLRNCAIQVEVLELMGQGTVDGETSLTFKDGDENELSIYTQGLILRAYVKQGVNDQDIDVAYFEPTEHRFWRIEERGGKVRFLASGDAHDWNELHVLTPSPPWVTEGYVVVSTWLAAPAATPARFDNVNVEPP